MTGAQAAGVIIVVNKRPHKSKDSSSSSHSRRAAHSHSHSYSHASFTNGYDELNGSSATAAAAVKFTVEDEELLTACCSYMSLAVQTREQLHSSLLSEQRLFGCQRKRELMMASCAQLYGLASADCDVSSGSSTAVDMASLRTGFQSRATAFGATGSTGTAGHTMEESLIESPIARGAGEGPGLMQEATEAICGLEAISAAVQSCGQQLVHSSVVRLYLLLPDCEHVVWLQLDHFSSTD